MTGPAVQRSRPRVRALLGCVVLVSVLASCTGEPTEQGPRDGSPASTAAPSVPFRVKVTRVAGSLADPRRQALRSAVTRTLTAYVDGAWLAGDYPRSSFARSFDAFTRGAARHARDDRAVLTNSPLGASTTSVRATRRTAYLSVLAPDTKAAGVTANVDLVFVVDRDERPARRVRLQGRLLLTRTSAGGQWRIFGYDVHRSSRAARSAS